MNFAARAGRWSAAHWKTATFGWLTLVVAAVVVGQLVGTVKLTDSEQSTGQSAQAQAIVSHAGFHDHAGEAVLIRSASRTTGDPAFRREVRTVVGNLSRSPEVILLRSPLTPGHRGQISRDGHSALIEFQMRGSADSAADRVQPILDRVGRLQHAAPAYTIAEFGDASANHELNKTVNDGVSKAERLSLPITFVVLLIAFGAFVAAGIPVVLAFSAVLAAGGLAAAASHLFHASGATSSVMLLMGMAVGVDYSLFYLKREREERRGGRTDSLERAAATSGRAVLVSGDHRPDRDGRDAPVGHEGVRLDRNRGDAGRVHGHGRLADRAARAARTARRQGRQGPDPPGTAHIPGVGCASAPRPALPGRGHAAVRVGARRAGAPDTPPAHDADRRGRPAPQHPDRQDLRRYPEGVPGCADPGAGRASSG